VAEAPFSGSDQESSRVRFSGRHEPGTGEIHYNRVLKEAYDLGYRGYVGLECRPMTTELAAAVAVAKADVW